MTLTLTKKEHLIDNVWSFVFAPDAELAYEAGQYVRVKLPHEHPDDEGIKRFFTNAAPPFEGVLQITTRITGSTFKQALAALEPGNTSLELIKKPEGDFLWRASDKPLILVAAGIGVTPYYAMLAERVHENLPISATLLYNGRTDALPWKDEFGALADAYPEFSVEYLIGSHLSGDVLAERYPALKESLVYVSGPEKLVDTLGEQLQAAGLTGEQVVQDWFPRYDDSNY